MNHKTYGIWLVACIVAMPIIIVAMWKSCGALAIPLGIQGGTCLMLLGRCAWKMNNRK
jgi:hypothetical protein